MPPRPTHARMSIHSVFQSIALVVLAVLLPAEYIARRKVLTAESKRGIWRRAIGTIASAATAWAMATAVDNGTTKVWTPPVQIIWGVSLLATGFTAIFLYAQAVALARGTHLPFLHDPTESPARRRAFRWTAIVGAALVALALVVRATPIVRARLAMAGIGVISVLLGLLRPGGFWDDPRVQVWRRAVGDAIVRLIYVGVGVAVIVWAFTTTLE